MASRLPLALVLAVLAGPGARVDAAETPAQPADEVIQLSPFEVRSDADTGYRATHTLSGTRMNSKLRDLAASISVVTAQQLEDTGSVDINDVFMYEGNTEGTHTYTAFATDRFGFADDRAIQMSPQTATRLRGIGAPDNAVDYFISLSQLPVDAYNIERITINRGPNSVLYGLGSAAGLVNSTLARAYIGGNTNRAELRLGSWGDFRASLSLNRTLIEDRLAIRVAALHHDRGYPQEPTYDRTRRLYGTITFQPFEKTTIRAFYENHANDYMRPNANTPMDGISNWITAGRPTFNPATMMVTRGGVQYPITGTAGPELTAAGNTGLANHNDATIPAFVFDQGQFLYRMPRQLGTTVTGFGTQLPERLLTSAPTPSPLPANWFAPGVSDKAIYDWEKINMRAGNFGEDEADTYQLMLEQQITKNLSLELGWRREVFQRYAMDAFTSGHNVVRIDVNERLLDGSTNPGFLKPYIEGWEPTGEENHWTRESMRGSAAYELDFTEKAGWMRWLGRHNLMGFGEKRTSTQRFWRWREAVISEHPWTGAPGTIHFSGASNARERLNRQYYLGSDAQITHAPVAGIGGIDLMPRPGIAGQNYPHGVIGGSWNSNIRYFIPGSPFTRDASRAAGYGVAGGPPVGTWVNEETVTATILHDANTNPDEQIRSMAGVLQSYFWDDRIVTTMGWRKDTRKSRFSPGARSRINAQGFPMDVPATINTFGAWDEITGKTNTRGVVVYPFAKWSWAPAMLQGISGHYNESETFQPAGLAWNLFREPLPLPEGEGKDWGFSFSLLEDKLVAKVNWYEAEQRNDRSGLVGALPFRSLRVDHEPENAPTTGATGWGLVHIATRQVEMARGVPFHTWNVFTALDTIPAEVQQQIATEAGYSSPSVFGPNWSGGPPRSDTQTLSSEGMEFSLDYNPTPHWTIKVTAGRQQTIQSEVLPDIRRFLLGTGTFEAPEAGSRLHFWQNYSYIDQRDLPAGWVPGNSVAGIPERTWWTTVNPDNNFVGFGPAEGNTPAGWTQGVVISPAQLALARQGLPNPQVREWRWSMITNYRFTEGLFKGTSVGGSARWEDEAAIGNYAMENPGNPGVFNLLDPNRTILDGARYYFDFWASYTMRMAKNRALKFQVNVRDAFRDPGLRVVGANADGSPRDYRIENGRQFFFSTTLEF